MPCKKKQAYTAKKQPFVANERWSSQDFDKGGGVLKAAWHRVFGVQANTGNVRRRSSTLAEMVGGFLQRMPVFGRFYACSHNRPFTSASFLLV